jgi:hypothetical protein
MTPSEFIAAVHEAGLDGRLHCSGGPRMPAVPAGTLPSGRGWILSSTGGCPGDGPPGPGDPMPEPLVLGFYLAGGNGALGEPFAMIDSLSAQHALRWVTRAWAGGEGTPLTYEEAAASLAPGEDPIHTYLLLVRFGAEGEPERLVQIGQDRTRAQVLGLFRDGSPCRAPRQPAEAGYGVIVHLSAGEPAVLVKADADPGRIAAVQAAAYARQDPSLRPLTFRAPALDTTEDGVTRLGWVNYWLPLDAWVAGLAEKAAALLSGGRGAEPIPAGVIGYEAICRGCGEAFGPDLSYADRSGLEHYQRADQRTPCGAAGDVLGWWGAPARGPERIAREGGWPRCLCGNTPDMDGFYPCLPGGTEVEPDAGGPWDGKHYLCHGCGRIINQDTLEVAGRVAPPSGEEGGA